MSNPEILRLIDATKRSTSIANKLGIPCPAHVAFVSRLQKAVNQQC